MAFKNDGYMEEPDELANTPANRLINRDELRKQGKLPIRITSRRR